MTVSIFKTKSSTWCELPNGVIIYGRDVEDVQSAVTAMSESNQPFRVDECESVQLDEW